jgi:hypothetical protein
MSGCPFKVGPVGLAPTQTHMVVGAPRSYLTPRASTLAGLVECVPGDSIRLETLKGPTFFLLGEVFFLGHLESTLGRVYGRRKISSTKIVWWIKVVQNVKLKLKN